MRLRCRRRRKEGGVVVQQINFISGLSTLLKRKKQRTIKGIKKVGGRDKQSGGRRKGKEKSFLLLYLMEQMCVCCVWRR